MTGREVKDSMLRRTLPFLIIALLAWTAFTTNNQNFGLNSLIKAYPDHLCNRGPNHVEWCDGTRMTYDDRRTKTFSEQLDDGDLQDQMHMKYPKTLPPEPIINFDPGRVRYEPFFKKMYGSTKEEVQSKLRTIQWMPGVSHQRIQMTSVNNVHKKIQRVSQELLLLSKPIRDVVPKASGTFVWRKIKNTNRLSTHSFGIAIDVGVKHSSYWLWSKPNKRGLYTFRNKIPLEVVAIFEKHGFIWGGKWYHFDSMHFEYRPELLEN